MTTFEIISLALNILFVSGGLVTLVTLRFTRKKAEEEAKEKSIDNDNKLINSFNEYIVEPLKKEVNGLRKDVRRLNRAIEKINDCPHAANCPVRTELQNDEKNGAEQ